MRQPTFLTPAYLRYSLRALQQADVVALPTPLARALLDYCLSDVSAMSPDVVRDLCELPLLPVQSGARLSMRFGGKEQRVVVVPAQRAGEDDVMAPVPDMCVDLEGLAAGTVGVLLAVAGTGLTNVRVLNAEVLAQHVLPAVIGAARMQEEAITCEEDDTEWYDARFRGTG